MDEKFDLPLTILNLCEENNLTPSQALIGMYEALVVSVWGISSEMGVPHEKLSNLVLSQLGEMLEISRKQMA